MDHLAGATLLALITACSARTTDVDPAPPPTPEATGAMTSIEDLHLVPWPAEVAPARGTLPLATLSSIVLSDPEDPGLRELAAYTATLLADEWDVRLDVASDPVTQPIPGSVALLLWKGETRAHPEQYVLEVTPQSIMVSAPTGAGLFYGLQTLRQLLPPEVGAAAAARGIPAVEILDIPRFSYRGMHLDVGRHFFPVEFVKKYIDLLAMYKMNTFHWHLTEDQGWRIEIEKYPRLTEIGSCRKETIVEKNFDPFVGDGIPYCGFYTQEEIREVVDHALRRYVTVIPEIEMPGHSVAALAAYPELACTEGPFEVSTRWGVTQDIYCPKEETFAFLEDVLTEVIELFPGTYVHIGGDEAPKSRWEASEVAQELIRREGLADEHELQSYFIGRIERFLLSNGRRLIGWDEILEGGLAPEATVMSWRGMEGGIDAARQGHDVIMTPTSHVYFDYYQGDPEFEPLAIGGYSPLEHVYAFEPVPEALTEDEAVHVLGAQGNVWTEYMTTTDYVEYMVAPRLLALSEVVWSAKGHRDWEHFTNRLPAHFQRLDGLGVRYRIPNVAGLEEDALTLDDEITVTLKSLMSDGRIHYTTDGTDPNPTAPRYTGSIRLPVNETGVTVTARLFLPNGRAGAPRSATFRKTTLRAATTLDEPVETGLRYAYYEYDGRVRSVEQLADMRPVSEGVAADVEIQGFAREENFGLVFNGYVFVPVDGIYTFFLSSDDGSRLLIGDEMVVDHDGLHGTSEKSGMIGLAAGYHPITVQFFQTGGGQSLHLGFAHAGATGAGVVARLFHLP
jgi:hexosaminidase